MPFPPSVLDLELNQWGQPEPMQKAYYVARVVEVKETSPDDFLKEGEKHRKNLMSRKKNMFLWLELPKISRTTSRTRRMTSAESGCANPNKQVHSILKNRHLLSF